MTTHFSLWLMPAPAHGARFARVIDSLSRRLEAPRFDPHVTLCGNRGGSEAEWAAQTEILAARLAPLELQLTDLDYTDEYFRCLYVQVNRSAELLRMRAAACRYLGWPDAGDFMPHLSLLYGSFSTAEKERLIGEIGRFDTVLRADRLALCAPSGPPAGWRIYGPFPLTGT